MTIASDGWQDARKRPLLERCGRHHLGSILPLSSEYVRADQSKSINHCVSLHAHAQQVLSSFTSTGWCLHC